MITSPSIPPSIPNTISIMSHTKLNEPNYSLPTMPYPTPYQTYPSMIYPQNFTNIHNTPFTPSNLPLPEPEPEPESPTSLKHSYNPNEFFAPQLTYQYSPWNNDHHAPTYPQTKRQQSKTNHLMNQLLPDYLHSPAPQAIFPHLHQENTLKPLSEITATDLKITESEISHHKRQCEQMFQSLKDQKHLIQQDIDYLTSYQRFVTSLYRQHDRRNITPRQKYSLQQFQKSLPADLR